jgi:hypothetical protein
MSEHHLDEPISPGDGKNPENRPKEEEQEAQEE